MRFVLLLFHLQFARLPPTMSLEALAKVAELCDKYDCVINTAHTIRSYVDSHDLETEALGSTIEATHWLWLGWVYAIKRWFIKGSSYILDHLAPCELKNLPIVPGPCKRKLHSNCTHQVQDVRIYQKIHDQLWLQYVLDSC